MSWARFVLTIFSSAANPISNRDAKYEFWRNLSVSTNLICSVRFFKMFNFFIWLSSNFGSLNHHNGFYIRDPAQKNYINVGGFETYPTLNHTSTLNDYWQCCHFGCWVGRDTALTRLPNSLLLLWVKTHHLTSEWVMKQWGRSSPYLLERFL